MNRALRPAVVGQQGPAKTQRHKDTHVPRTWEQVASVTGDFEDGIKLN